jgi:hypothetical protein
LSPGIYNLGFRNEGFEIMTVLVATDEGLGVRLGLVGFII